MAEESPMELEGIVRSVNVPLGYNDLFVLIDKEGLLYNTVLRQEGGGVNRELDETAIEQLSENIKPGDRIKVSVVKDDKYIESLPLYKVVSQYRIIERAEKNLANQQP